MRSRAVIEVEIDALQKRAAYLRAEERQISGELDDLWNEHREHTDGAMAASEE